MKYSDPKEIKYLKKEAGKKIGIDSLMIIPMQCETPCFLVLNQYGCILLHEQKNMPLNG